MTMQSKSLYRLPQEGMIRGVCAGLAHYFNIPVLLVRVIAVIALFAGFWLNHCCLSCFKFLYGACT